MSSLPTTYVVVNPGLNVAFKVLNQAENRVAIEVQNDGRVAGDIIGIHLGVQAPDLTKFTGIILPFGQWWPPSGVCLAIPLWLVWLTNAGASKCYVTEYTRT